MHVRTDTSHTVLALVLKRTFSEKKNNRNSPTHTSQRTGGRIWSETAVTSLCTAGFASTQTEVAEALAAWTVPCTVWIPVSFQFLGWCPFVIDHGPLRVL